MGNKLSTEEPQHVKTLKSKPNVRKEPAFQYHSAGWREGEFDDDAEEFSLATCKEPPGYDNDDEHEHETITNHRPDRHVSEDGFPSLELQRSHLEVPSSSRQDRAGKERKRPPIEDRCSQAQDDGDAFEACEARRHNVGAVAIQKENVWRQEEIAAHNASSETAGV
ncbi:hypothetical protein DOTSEDRAFT_27984 [Dothistroma septosporum NZE10]|uniref:Uncharacterized protein n=1 Tax=Dothistroma septosporum (strain NZE10 / CBS 128990) TaxID=675120 RepID=N1PD91_DOTSN|nr:hypothetical protein DOTSEDRAFT_27984 [Dothistroma septosporum NZE10]